MPKKSGSNQVQSKSNPGSMSGWALQLRKKKLSLWYWVPFEERMWLQKGVAFMVPGKGVSEDKNRELFSRYSLLGGWPVLTIHILSVVTRFESAAPNSCSVKCIITLNS